jgi:hypothetical protein
MAKDTNYTTGDATLVFKGLTLEQAKCFAHWYEGQAEQDTTWFEEQGIPAPMSNVGRKPRWMEVDDKAKTVTCYLHTPPD